MNLNKESEINAAFTQGLIGLAAMFYVFSEQISIVNKNVFTSLIALFVILSLIRVFGIILNIEYLKISSVDLFALLGLPFTLYVASRIIITEIYPNIYVILIIPFYIFISTIIYMIIYRYNLEIKINIKKKEDN